MQESRATSSATARPSFEGVMYLRALTGIIICGCHAYTYFGKTGFIRASLMFFIISGFMIALTAEPISRMGDRAAALDFARKRLIRIVPLYWLSIAVMTIGYWADWVEASDSLKELYWNWNPTLTSFIKDMVFIPHQDFRGGRWIWPVNVPAWTLNYEMIFYSLFAALILVGRWKIPIAVALLCALSLFQYLTESPDQQPLYKWYAWLEFALGLCMFTIWRRYPATHLSPRLAALCVIAGLVTGVSGMLLKSHFGVTAGCALLIWGFLFTPGGRHAVLRFLRKVGDASYAIYISHTPVGLALAYVLLDRLEIKARVESGEWGLVAVVAAILWSTMVSVAVGLLVHRYIERPLVGVLLKKPGKSKPMPSVSPLVAQPAHARVTDTR